jgi:hypothetical protein
MLHIISCAFVTGPYTLEIDTPKTHYISCHWYYTLAYPCSSLSFNLLRRHTKPHYLTVR